MDRGIKPFAEVMGIHRIAVYKLQDRDEQSLGQVYLWHGRTLPLEEDMMVVPKVSSTDRWLEALVKGDCINLNAREAADDEIAFLDHFGAKSVFFVPIFTYGQFWGVITLEDHTNYRQFDEENIGLLRTAAHLCAGAIVQYETDLEVAEKNELNRIMFENAPIGMVVFDDSGNLLDCNDTILKMLGVTKERFLNDPGGLTPECQPDGSRTVERAHDNNRRVFNGEKIKTEWMHLDQDGHPVPCDLTLVPVKQGDRYIGLSYFYDLREQNRLKAEIEKALYNAQEASRAKSEFLSRMSHEMRTPMNTIMGLAQVARMSSSPKEIGKYLDDIGGASRVLLGLIDDVLDMSSIEHDSFKLLDAAFDFGAMIGDVLQAIGHSASEKRQAFTSYISPSIPPTLIGDERRLKQVIVSLLVNAVKYTPEQGKIHLAAVVLEKADENVTMRFEITDSGVGISKEKQDDIFAIFQQADGGVARKHQGVGLGLALSKHIIEMMGGQIHLDSEPGKGSKFTFTCKLKREAQQ
jgi:PAS domain S-box-containing protein